MKFIFPQNYNFNTKLFGVIDYSTLFINLIWWIIIFIFSYFLFNNLSFKIIFFIITCFPIFFLSIIGFNHENIFYVISYLFKYLKNNKIYLYKKSEYL